MSGIFKTLGLRLLLLGLVVPVLVGAGAQLFPGSPSLGTLALGVALALSLGLSGDIARHVGLLGRIARQLDLPDTDLAQGPVLREGLLTDIDGLASTLAQTRREMQDEIEQATSDLCETMESLEIRNVELDLARRRALAAGNAKSEFLANMSHEVRTPLNGITGFTNLLCKTRLTREQREYVDAIARSSEALLEIVNDVLDFSTLESGKRDLDSQVFNVRECLDEAVTFMAPQAHAKGLELVAMIYNDLPDLLVGDPSRIRQILTNLLGNAVKFTAEGEIQVRAMLAEEDTDSCRLELTVTDTGIGLAPAVRAGLFRPFSQGGAEIHRLYGGTGLGLSICRKLVESMSGSIDAKTREGAGSTFRFDLALRKPGADALPRSRPSPVSGREVALYDGHAFSRASLRGRMEYAGLSVRTYEDTETLTLAAGSDARPIVLGLSAKEFRSGRTAKLLQSLKQDSPAPLLLLISSSDRGELERALRLGADACHSKPLGDTALRDALTRLLRPGEQREMVRPRMFSSAVPRLTHRHFLVADDNPINLRLISTLLRSSGAHVTQARNGREVLELMDMVRFDLLLLDVHMPERDGLEVARAVRQRTPARGGQVPILGLTADASPDNRYRVLGAGMDDCLTKPTDERQLWSQVSRLLGADLEDPSREATEAQLPNPSEPIPPGEVPHRDREAASRIPGGNPDLAREMFEMLVAGLPEQIQEVRGYLFQRNWALLRESLHRLRGATAICAVSTLHASVGALMEAARQEAYDEAFGWLDQLDSDARELVLTADRSELSSTSTPTSETAD